MDESEGSAGGQQPEQQSGPRAAPIDAEAWGRFLLQDRRCLETRLVEWAAEALQAAGLPSEPGMYVTLSNGEVRSRSEVDVTALTPGWVGSNLSGLVERHNKGRLLFLAARLLELIAACDRSYAFLAPRLDERQWRELRRLERISCRLGYVMAQIEHRQDDQTAENLMRGVKAGAEARTKHAGQYLDWMAENEQLKGMTKRERIERLEKKFPGTSGNTIVTTLDRIAKRHPKPAADD